MRGKGVAIPASGNQGGTLSAVFTGLSAADAAFAGARTTSASGAGRAGLAYPGPRAEEAGRGRVFVFGLRDTAEDRTNLALVNAGTSGSVSVGITLTSGDPADPRSISALGARLAPGQWLQANAPDLLRAVGMRNAWATIEPEAGTSPYLAYAVFNDNRTDDGSYVPAVRNPVAPAQILPVLVESDAFQSELVLANPTNHPMDASLRLALSLGTFLPGTNPTLTLTLAPHEQRIIPAVLQAFRAMGLGIEPAGPGKTIVGTLTATFTPSGGEPAAGFVGARTASPAPLGGGYGLFYAGVPTTDAAQEEAWVFGLVQDASSRSNVALLNAGPGLTEIALRVDVFDAATGALAGGTDVTLGGGRWTQLNGILATYGLSKGMVRVTTHVRNRAVRRVRRRERRRDARSRDERRELRRDGRRPLTVRAHPPTTARQNRLPCRHRRSTRASRLCALTARPIRPPSAPSRVSRPRSGPLSTSTTRRRSRASFGRFVRHLDAAFRSSASTTP